MNYDTSTQKSWIDCQINLGTFRIDYSTESIYHLGQAAYFFITSFHALGVTRKNSERFILRAINRSIEEHGDFNKR